MLLGLQTLLGPRTLLGRPHVPLPPGPKVPGAGVIVIEPPPGVRTTIVGEERR